MQVTFYAAMGEAFMGWCSIPPYSFVVPHIGNKNLFVHIQQMTKNLSL
jgi:hypothetical protein